MRGFFGFLVVSFVAYALELNWVAVIFVLAAIGKLIPDKKSKKKTKKKKSSSKPTDLPSGKRTKLKIATKLKKTDLPAAISMLKEAYDDGEAISLDEFLRLPNYLRMNKQYDEAFQEWLEDHYHDLHYRMLPTAVPYAFGSANLWRIATAWPGSPVPPCIHRAPDPIPGQKRLLLIS